MIASLRIWPSEPRLHQVAQGGPFGCDITRAVAFGILWVRKPGRSCAASLLQPTPHQEALRPINALELCLQLSEATGELKLEAGRQYLQREVLQTEIGRHTFLGFEPWPILVQKGRDLQARQPNR